MSSANCVQGCRHCTINTEPVPATPPNCPRLPPSHLLQAAAALLPDLILPSLEFHIAGIILSSSSYHIALLRLIHSHCCL